MGDILQVLIVIGIIVFAIVRQSAVSREKEKEQRRSPVARPTADEEDRYKAETAKKSPKPFLSCDYDYSTSFAGTTEQQLSAPTPVGEEPDDDKTAFDIRSAEEVRRAIIWSEILNRKY